MALALVLALAFLKFLASPDECFFSRVRVRFRLGLLLLCDIGAVDVGSGGVASGGVRACCCAGALLSLLLLLLLEVVILLLSLVLL
jgi:hypothetical protein